MNLQVQSPGVSIGSAFERTAPVGYLLGNAAMLTLVEGASKEVRLRFAPSDLNGFHDAVNV